MVVVGIPLAAAIVGLVLVVLAARPGAAAWVAELGRALLWAGLFVVLLALSHNGAALGLR